MSTIARFADKDRLAHIQGSNEHYAMIYIDGIGIKCVPIKQVTYATTDQRERDTNDQRQRDTAGDDTGSISNHCSYRGVF